MQPLSFSIAMVLLSKVMTGSPEISETSTGSETSGSELSCGMVGELGVVGVVVVVGVETGTVSLVPLVDLFVESVTTVLAVSVASASVAVVALLLESPQAQSASAEPQTNNVDFSNFIKHPFVFYKITSVNNKKKVTKSCHFVLHDFNLERKFPYGTNRSDSETILEIV